MSAAAVLDRVTDLIDNKLLQPVAVALKGAESALPSPLKLNF